MTFFILINPETINASQEDNMNSQPFIIDKNADCVHFKNYEVYSFAI